MSRARAQSGLAVAALGIILVITAAWWALALWPAAGNVPEWVLRTRAACFGRTASGLPNAGGWILLVGEPIGMAAVLMAVWGDALRKDFRALAASLSGRVTMAVVALLTMVGGAAAAQRVQTALNASNVELLTARSVIENYDETRYHQPAPVIHLTDQRGMPFSLDTLSGQRVILTFAYAHCETVCPTIVHDLKSARRKARAEDAALVIVTLDPWRDVPSRLSTIAEQWELAPGDRILSGPVDEVLNVLDKWEVSHVRDERTGEIIHSSAVVLLDRDGLVSYRMSGDWQRTAGLLETL